MVTEIRSFKKHAIFCKVSRWGRRGGSLFVVLYGIYCGVGGPHSTQGVCRHLVLSEEIVRGVVRVT